MYFGKKNENKENEAEQKTHTSEMHDDIPVIDQKEPNLPSEVPLNNQRVQSTKNSN